MYLAFDQKKFKPSTKHKEMIFFFEKLIICLDLQPSDHQLNIITLAPNSSRRRPVIHNISNAFQKIKHNSARIQQIPTQYSHLFFLKSNKWQNCQICRLPHWQVTLVTLLALVIYQNIIVFRHVEPMNYAWLHMAPLASYSTWSRAVWNDKV